MTQPMTRAGAALACALALWGCNEQQLAPGISRDLTAPSVEVSRGADTVDVATGIDLSIIARDNLALRSVSVSLAGGFARTIDTTFTGTVAEVTIPVAEQFDDNSTAGGFVFISASATDGAGNVSETVTDSIFLFNENALIVTLARPGIGATSAPGKSLPVQVDAEQRDGIQYVGYYTTGVLETADSVLAPIGELPTDMTFNGSLRVPDGNPLGSVTIRGFGVDAFSRRVESAARVIEVLSSLNDTIAPTVTFTVNDRVEVDDSITVRGTDPSGITELGWVANRLSDGTVVGQNSQTFGGDSTDVEFTWSLNLNAAAVGQTITIDAYAIDASGNDTRATATSSPAGSAAAAQQAQRDTVVVVFGVTRPLPAGGRVADAIYNANLNEVYLTNVALGRLEVFQLADTTFAAGGIRVGAQPWGIALWPTSTAGVYADTVVVANSGGVNLSIVDVDARIERRRHILPNFLIQTVKTEIDEDNGDLRLQIVEYDLSDRPQYVGTTCRTAACPEVYAVYSTTPTPTQPAPFTGRGSIRWERIDGAAAESHFFWEHATADVSDATDTLQIIADRGGFARDTVLSAACGRIVALPELGFSDTTFVRNSGDFTNALVGEGGASPGPVGPSARAIGYDAEAGVVSTACSATVQGVTFDGREDVDLGVSPAIRVGDFIVNTATPVRSIGINFNGLTKLIRADSVWVLNGELKLVGSIPLGGVNAGVDLNFDHAFDAGAGGTPGTDGGGGDPDNRLLFAAGPAETIEVYDTWFYGRVVGIPIRDPVIGPLRVAETAAGEQILIGVTSAGVVLVRLPAISNLFPVSQWPMGQ